MDDIQVLTPMNRGGLGVRALNSELQQRLNASSEPRIEKFGSVYAPGDKILQRVNNYDKDVFNGDIGRITAIDLKQNTVIVDFDNRAVSYELDELSLAYAASIHRGKQLLVVIAEPKALRMAVRNRQSQRSITATGRAVGEVRDGDW